MQGEYDVLIVGGGPAGLSAALVLGRALCKVAVFDHGRQRHRFSRHLHNYLTRDGMAPSEFIALSRAEVSKFDVTIRDEEVISAACVEQNALRRFTVTTQSGTSFSGRKILFTTGVSDVLPDLPGMQQLYGRGVHHCPYCDAYQYRGTPLIALGDGMKAVRAAHSLRAWSQIVYAAPLLKPFTAEEKAAGEQRGVTCISAPIASLQGEQFLEAVILRTGEKILCSALFFNTDHPQQSELPRMLGCGTNPRGEFQTSRKQQTEIPGVFIAGDADGDVQFVVVAAAEGATVGVAIHAELMRE